MGDMLLSDLSRIDVVNNAISHLTEENPSWRRLEFYGTPKESPGGCAQVEELTGCRIFKEVMGYGSYLTTTGNYEEYNESQSTKFRSNMRRRIKKLGKLGDIQTNFVENDEADAVHLQKFFDLENSGWKGKNCTSILSSQKTISFYTSLVRRLQDANMLEWHFLKAGDKIVAGHLAVKTKGKLSIWKIAYDEDHPECSPGNILAEHLYKRAFAAKEIDEVDCVTFHNWHNDWCLAKRPYYKLTISPDRIAPYIMNLASFQAGKLVKRAKSALKSYIS
jgi:hypothetical protein